MKNLCIAILLLTELVAHSVSADQIKRELVHGGVSRSYLLYIPSAYEQEKPLPLLVVLHGRPGNAQRMADLTAFNSRAEKHGFVVVYPEGIGKHWNYLHGISGSREHPDDSDFLLKVINMITGDYSIDESRVYVTGISNGGFMTQRLACYAVDRFAAFASVAAGGYGAMPVECGNDTSVNILYIHGTADEKVPWKGLAVEDGNGNWQLVTMSITDSLKFWSSRNHCGTEVTAREIPPAGQSPGTRVKVLGATECSAGAEVVLYAIVGGGHNWPGVPGFIPPPVAGRVNMDIHASDVVWSFFEGKRKSKQQ